jgi:hypothetical protein
MERDPVDEVLVEHVPAGVQADERRPVAILDADHLRQVHRALLGEELARLGPHDDVERPEMPSDDGRPGLEVERPVAGPEGDTQTAPRVDLGDRAPGIQEHPGCSRHASDGFVDDRQRIREVEIARMHVHGVDLEVVPASDVEGRVEPLRIDPELRGAVPRVRLTPSGEGGPDPWVDADADRRAG